MAIPLAATAVLFQLRDFLRRYFFTRHRPAMAFTSDAVGYLGLLLMLFLLFPFFTFDSAAVLWLIGATSAAAVFVSLPFLGELAWRIGTFFMVLGRHWHFAKWMGASVLLQWVATNLFLAVTGGLLGTAAVGAIRAAQTPLGVSSIFIQGLENVVPLRAADHLTRVGRPALRNYLRRVALAGGIATSLIGIVAALAPGFWLQLFFGESYAAYGHLLYWYAVIYVVMFMGLPLRAGLRALERTRPIFQSYAYAALFTLLTVYPLLTSFELTGAMMGILGVHLILLVVLLRALRVELARA